MRKIYFFKSFIIALSIFSAGILTAQDKTLLVVGSEITAGGHALDTVTVDSLISWGFGVKYSEDGAFNSATEDILTDIYGVVFCESMGSGNTVAFKTWGYPTPCLCMELYAPRKDRWDWLTNNDTQFTRNEPGTDDDEIMVIRNNEHYITEIYNVGDEIQFTDPPDAAANTHAVVMEDQVEYEDVLAGLKSFPDEDWCFLFTVEAPESEEKMVMWGYNAAGIVGDGQALYAKQDFWTIMRRSAQWVFDEEVTGIKPVSIYKYNLKVNPNPAKEVSFVRFHADVNSTAEVSILNITGQEIEMIFAGEVNNTKNIPFNVTGYAPGIYFVKLKINNDFQISKFIVE